MKTVMRRPELMLVALAGAAALDITGRLSIVGGVKLTIYQVLLGVTLVVTAWLVHTGQVKVRGTAVDLWIALLVASAGAALIGAASLGTGIVAFVSLCSSLLLVYLVAMLAPTTDQVRTVLTGLLLLGATLGFLAVIERLGIFSVQPLFSTTADGIRARVTFDDTNSLGGVLAATAVVGMPLALAAKGLWRKALAWSCVAAAMVGVVATLSRGALLGLVVGAVVVVVFAPIRARTRIALVGAGVLGVVVLLGVVLDPAWVAAKLTGIGDNESALYRLYLMRSAARMFVDHPLGIGPGNWATVITAYHDPRLPANLLESHTTIVTVLVENGPIGALALLATWFVAAWKMAVAAVKAPGSRVEVASALGGVAVLLVQSMTYSIETNKFLWLLIGAGLAAAAASWTPGKETT